MKFVAIFGFLEIGKLNNCPSHVLNVRVPIGISLKETSVEVVSSSTYPEKFGMYMYFTIIQMQECTETGRVLHPIL